VTAQHRLTRGYRFRALGDTGGQADVLFMLGTFGMTTGDYQRAARLLTDSLTLLRARGDEKTTARGLAGAAAARGDYEHAAELDGARDALRAQLGVLFPPLHPAAYARTLATVRARLTPAAFDAARARPAHQTPQQIITAATSNSNSPPPKSAH
jgi:hypothetical protein